MMKRMLACLANAVFWVGLAGIAQAAGLYNVIDFCSEGPADQQDYKERQIIPTKLRHIKGDTLYLEGMGTSSHDEGIKTIVPIGSYNLCDFSAEGFSHVELEQMRIIKIHDEIAPAAGKKTPLMKLMEPRLNVLDFF